MTHVVVARSCWAIIEDELDRVAPREGVLLPLVAIAHRAEPCALVELRDIETVALAHVHRVPAHLQRNELAHVSALPCTDAWVDGIVLPLVRRCPRLRAAAYLHSHPFATEHTRPSSGDIHGHMLPLLERNRDAGLAASFSFIACRRRGRRGWHLPCFAADARRRIAELGETAVVDDGDPIIAHAHRERMPRFELRRWIHQLRRRGFAVRADELFDGWSRIRIRLDARRLLVALFPLTFPDEAPRYHLVDTHTHRAQRLALRFTLDASEVA